MMLVDFHSHILPRMDDGSSSVDQSTQMLQMEKEQGIGAVVATPHFYPSDEAPNKFLARRAEAADMLNKELLTEYPHIHLGAEVYYYPGMSESEALKSLTIAGGKGILVEMPMTTWTEQMYRELEGIYLKQGLTPIVAHVERYLGFWGNRKLMKRLAQLPVMIQVNAWFFLDRRTCKKAMKMLRKGQIHLLGSDCHNLDSRSPNLGKAVAQIRQTLGENALEQIAYYQSLILEDSV